MAQAAGERLFALKPLEPSAEPLIAIAGPHGKHVRMQIRHGRLAGAAFNAGHGHRKTDEAVCVAVGGKRSVEGANHLPARLLVDLKNLARLDLDGIVAPSLRLQIDAGLQLVKTSTGADLDHRRPSAAARCFLASAQSASSSSAESSSSGRALHASMARKRSRKRRLQPRSACSASTCR